MSRFRFYQRSVVASYALLGSNIVYTLASVPLMLVYLSKDQFGLWATTSQLLAFITLLDLGTNSSMARLLIDRKDDENKAIYGSFIKAGILIGIVQSGFIFLCGLLLLGPIAHWLDLTHFDNRTFVSLMLWMITISCISFAARIFGQLLHAWQRLDILYYLGIGNLCFSFAGLALGLVVGLGIYATALGAGCGALFSILGGYIACNLLKLWPGCGAWGSVTTGILREVFSYGLDLFIIALSTQVILASQTLLVTRYIGLEAAATWAIMTKMFSLVSQALWRFVSNAMPAMSEMVARGEYSVMTASVRLMAIGVGIVAAVTSVVFATTNGLFVLLWTDGRVSWDSLNNILLALWLFILTQQCISTSVLICLKKVTLMKYVYLAEATIFLTLAVILTGYHAMTGLITASLVSTIACSWIAGQVLAARFLKISFTNLFFVWYKPALKVAAFMTLVAFALTYVIAGRSAEFQLLIALVSLGTAAIVAVSKVGLPEDVCDMLRARLPGFLRWCVPG